MKNRTTFRSLHCPAGLRAALAAFMLIFTGAMLLPSAAGAEPLSTAFTYQGRLTDGGQPANGSHEFEFTLFDALTGGTNLGTVTREEVQVTEGIFSVELDFGAAAFDGNARWLEISVRNDSDGLPGAVLTPRQPVTAAPYALMAKDVPDGAITGAKLANGAVTGNKLAAGAVGASNIAAGAVSSSHIAAGGVEAANLATGSVGSAQIAAGAVSNDKLGAGAAFQNLLANGQSPVGSHGVIMSPLADAPALTGAGYTPIGSADLVQEAWTGKAPAPDGPAPPVMANHLHSVGVWTGTEMIVWGGPTNSGGRYNVQTNTWTPMSTVNAPAARSKPVAVWTGTEMIVWGGYTGSSPAVPVGTGGRYNPTTNTWTALPTTGAPSARFNHTAVWTGSQMIIWGGSTTGAVETTDGARYNPSNNTWTSIATSGSLTPRAFHHAVWTGSRMLIAGGRDWTHNVDIYDPAANSWTVASAYSVGTAVRGSISAVWTGTQFIMMDGGDDTNGRLLLNNLNGTPVEGLYGQGDVYFEDTMTWTGSRIIYWGVQEKKIYNPATETWQPMSTAGAPGAGGHIALWTGSKLIIWGAGEATGALYDPATDTWSPMAGQSELGSRSSGFSHVWTGNELMIWGGVDGGNKTVQGGMRYNHTTNTWSLMSTVNAPSARIGHTAVWTGTEMIVWGGMSGDAEDIFYDGARYNPVTDAWTVLPMTGAPGVTGHRAVWTGSEMIVVGVGAPGSTLQGRRYNPVTNMWSVLTMTNAPAARTNFALLWTGAEMILWGGGNLGVGNATGGRFNPATNTWTPMTLVNAPPGRSHPGAVWSGSEMIIFGGGPDFGIYPTINGRYNPATNTWTTLPATGAPSARAGHSVVWDGTQVIVFGGQNSSGNFLWDGKLYSPLQDKWLPMLYPNSQEARTDHAAVWAGNQMLVWGGRDGDGALRTTNAYTPKRTFYFFLRP